MVNKVCMYECVCFMQINTYKTLSEKFLRIFTEKYGKSSKSNIFAVPENVRGLPKRKKKKKK